MKLTETIQGTVYYKNNHGELDIWQKVDVLKPGVQVEDFENVCLRRLDDRVELSKFKKDWSF